MTEQRVAVVTGASRGVGKGIALALMVESRGGVLRALRARACDKAAGSATG